jgi:hypothetical protein
VDKVFRDIDDVDSDIGNDYDDTGVERDAAGVAAGHVDDGIAEIDEE